MLDVFLFIERFWLKEAVVSEGRCNASCMNQNSKNSVDGFRSKSKHGNQWTSKRRKKEKIKTHFSSDVTFLLWTKEKVIVFIKVVVIFSNTVL